MLCAQDVEEVVGTKARQLRADLKAKASRVWDGWFSCFLSFCLVRQVQPVTEKAISEANTRPPSGHRRANARGGRQR